nr:Peptidase family S51 [uncultured bacterium]
MKLFLYSTWQMSARQRTALAELVGKDLAQVKIAAITNAIDVVEDSKEWIGLSLASLGGEVEEIDLRHWQGNPAGLREKLAGKDVIWLSAGNGFYLRWLLRETGADTVIKELVEQRTIYAGWGGGAVIAGPTLHFFEDPDELAVVPEVITDGLNITDTVIVPHMDLGEFADQMKKIHENLVEAGFKTVPLNEDQALIIDGGTQRVI